MAGFTLATVNTAPVEEAITEEPIQAPISEDEVEVAAEPSPVKATEDATSPAKVVAPVEQQPDAEAMEPEASMQASPAPAAVSNSTPSKAVMLAASPAKEAVSQEPVAEAVEPDASVQASPAPAAVANSPPAKAAVAASPVAAMTKCIRRAGCTCPDCAEMSGLSLKPTEEDAGAIKCIRKAGCNCADCSVMAGLTLTTASPAKAVEETVEEQEPTPTADVDIAAVPSPAKEVVPAKEEPVQEALSDEPAAEVEAPTAPVPASPPAKAAVAASPAGAMIKCIRRAGCTCPDCAEMSGLTLASAAPTQALVEEAPPAEEAAVMEVAAVPASPAKEVIAEIETPPVPPSPVKKIAATAEPNLPEATSAESRAPQVTVQQGATFAAQGNAQGKCIRKPACMSCDCAEMSGLALAPKAATAEVKCIRKAGCTCPDCAEMQGLSCAAAPFAAPVKEKTAPASPAQAAPTSAKKSAKKSAVKKSAVKFAQSPAFKAVPEFKSMSPAFSKDEESDVFSPEGFANAEALKAMLEDDGLELDDMTDLRISAVNESMRAEMKAALAQMHAAKDSAAKDSANTKELRTQDEVQCEIASEWGAPKLSEAGKEACAAPSCGASNSADARYTLEDVERISSFNMEALKRRMETEISELCTKLDASRKDAKTSNQALEDENTLLKKTMQEAETAIDELVAVVDTEKKDGAKHLKSFTDMKSYADELENAFNGLHGRYTKLKEYYKASDENNQVLSKSMLDTNELLKTHQTQLQAANDKMKTLEDKVIVERQSRSSELSLVTDKLTLAERQLSTSDATMLHLKMETHKAQQDLTRERLKLEDAKASFSQQLKSLGGGSKDADDRACKAQAEITELKMQMRMVKEAAAAAEANKDDAAALKMMKIQLQKAEIDKRGLAQQIEQKTKENEELNKMCDELLSDLEKKKCS